MADKWTLEEVEAINAARRGGRHGDVATLFKPEPKFLNWAGMPKHEAILNDWETQEILIEGSLNSGKSTVALDKEITALLRWPGIPILLWRWTEDSCAARLKPLFEQLLQLRVVDYVWDRDQHCYHLSNGSRAYAFGLKTQSAAERMQKLRGLGVTRILGDQVEEADRGVADELRGRLRPDLTATLSGVTYPYQLTFIANPSDEGFWLSRQWPLDNSITGRKMYSLSVHDNRYLPQSTIDTLLRTWPPTNPKHRTMILGLRGVNVVGDPVYDGLYVPEVHTKPLTATATVLLESFEIGKKNSVWIVGQRTHHGALHLLGGCLGQGLALEDFLRIVRQLRAEWYPNVTTIRTCATPVGEKETQQSRISLLDILRQWDIRPQWRDISNQPDVVLTIIEELASYLRRRTPTGAEESFCVNTTEDRWVIATRETGLKSQPFVAHALGGGYVWDDSDISVAHKTIRRPREDGFYANIMRCIQTLVLTFCMQQPTDAQRQGRQLRDREARLDNPTAHLGNLAWMAY